MRHDHLALAGCLALALGAAPAARAQQRPQHAARASDTLDVLITGGTIVDGSGGPARVGDVGIRGDRIVFVGRAPADARRLPARRRIDAHGRIVAPGFIDPHTHAGGDLSSPAGRGNLPFLMQGVTTVVVGNDGGGPVDVAATLARWERDGIGTNAALLTGFGTIRQRVLGMSAAPATPAQLDAMRALVDSAMREGALGLSTGLFYPPQSFAATEEVIELAKVAARHGGLYDTHLRDESSYNVGLLGSIEETLRIGREAGLPVHVAHIKALGADVWGQSDTVVALVRAARRQGMNVTADQYPYTASGTAVGASLLPIWATAGGRDSLFARMADPVQHARLAADMKENLRRRGGAASLLVRSARDTTLIGKTLADIAAARHLDPVEAAMEIIRAGDAGVASFNMKESDIERFMTQDFVMTGSDGSEGMPRKYGTFPKKLHDYVFTKHLLTLPFAVRQSTAFTAETFHLDGRGRLAPGWYADVVVFDSTIVDHATYTQSERLATGVQYVVVNGKLAVDHGKATGVLAGRGVRRAEGARSADGAAGGGAPPRGQDAGAATPSANRTSAPVTAASPAAPGAGLARGIAIADSLVAAAVGTQFPGAVLVVARNGRVLEERAFGHVQLFDDDGRRVARPRPVRTTTLFDLASVTKVMATTFGVMLLVDRGQVDVDAPVSRYLPDFRGAHLDSVTVRHLLTHSAGLAQWQPLYYHAANGGQSYAAIRDMPLEWGVGEGRHYSDLGFMLLGQLVERVSGRPLDQFLQRELYAPLGLRATTFNPKTHGFTDFATTERGNGYERHMVYDSTFGYRYEGDPTAWDGWRRHVLAGEVNDGNAWYANGGVAGHAGLFSTAAELRVLLDLLNGRGSYGGRRYLRPETVERFLTRDRFQHYLGWMAPRDMPEGSFAHNGFTGTYVLGVPAYGLSVVLLTNRQNMGTDARGYFANLAPLDEAVARAFVSGAAADAETAAR